LRSPSVCPLSRLLRALPSFPPRRSSDLVRVLVRLVGRQVLCCVRRLDLLVGLQPQAVEAPAASLLALDEVAALQLDAQGPAGERSEEHTSELQSRENLVCRLLLEKKNAD